VVRDSVGEEWWWGETYLEGVPAAADAELLVVGQAADRDGVGLVVSGVHGELALDLRDVRGGSKRKGQGKKYRLLEPFHRIRQYLVVEPVCFAQLGFEELGKPHVEKGGAAEGASAGGRLLDLEDRLEVGDGVRDEIDSATAGVADDEAGPQSVGAKRRMQIGK
jgi:hypothetical protein